jgi:hypothetical protein
MYITKSIINPVNKKFKDLCKSRCMNLGRIVIRIVKKYVTIFDEYLPF